jgi:uncharacterized protein with GYD domain
MFYKTEDVCAYINKATCGLSGIAKRLMQRTEIWQWRCLIQVNDYYAVSGFAVEHESRFGPVGAGLQYHVNQQPGRMTMATYVVLARFTDQGVKNAKDSPKRAEAFKQMAKTFGVTVKDIFWTQGRYDIVTVIEAPDELSAVALNLSLSALGNIHTESLRAFSSADMMKIVAKML